MTDKFEVVFQEGEKWYFWDEAGFKNGPYNTKEHAEAGLDYYVETELNYTEKPQIRKMRHNMGA